MNRYQLRSVRCHGLAPVVPASFDGYAGLGGDDA
jgi:hypothetical protein